MFQTPISRFLIKNVLDFIQIGSALTIQFGCSRFNQHPLLPFHLFGEQFNFLVSHIHYSLVTMSITLIYLSYKSQSVNNINKKMMHPFVC